MKKIRLLLVALLVLAIVPMALVACTPTEKEPTTCTHTYVDGVCSICGEKDPNYVPPQPADVPTEEGKVTFYFTLGEGSVEIAEHFSPYITGGAFGWATGAAAPEFKNLEGTNVWYTIAEPVFKEEDAQKFDYQIVLGLNAASGVATEKQGLAWVDSYKSTECAQVAYPNNPQFADPAGANTVNLGTHTFATTVPAPIEVTTTLTFTFAEALPEGRKVTFWGSINNWGNSEWNEDGTYSQPYMATSTDNKVWKLTFTGVLAQGYEGKLVVLEPETAATKENMWNGTVYGKAGSSTDGSNHPFEIAKFDNNAEVAVYGVELVYTVPVPVDVTVSFTLEEALGADAKVVLLGDFNGWTYNEAALMTSTDQKVWTMALSQMTVGKNYSFKILVFANGIPEGTENIWDAGAVQYGTVIDGSVGNGSVSFTAANNGATVALNAATVTATAA